MNGKFLELSSKAIQFFVSFMLFLNVNIIIIGKKIVLNINLCIDVMKVFRVES
jgi:hypothetical protein